MESHSNPGSNVKHKRYIVVGDDIMPAPILIRLYAVDPEECLIANRDNVGLVLDTVAPNKRSTLIRLFPRCDGIYSLSA